MGLLTYLILLAISGLVVGALARLALPGPDPMGIGKTILIGLAGSFVGGFLGRILFGNGDSLVQPSSWIGSTIGAVLVLMIYLLIKRRVRTDPASD